MRDHAYLKGNNSDLTKEFLYRNIITHGLLSVQIQNFCFHNIWIIWDKDGGSLRVRVGIVWVMEMGGVIISVEIFTLKYCSSVRIYVCRKGFQLVLYITAWVFGVEGWECIYVACVLFEL